MKEFLIVSIIFAVLGLIAGLMVGRKNPKVADTAATMAQDVDALLKKKP
jgi:Na+-translocating ferredoxin:NAD+ oxidoreductase RNF subunit RnfB